MIPHPILDVSPYPLHVKEAGEFHVILFQDIQSIAAAVNFYNQCGGNLPPVSQQNIGVTWQEILFNVAAAGLTRNLFSVLSRANYARVIEAIKKMEAMRSVIEEDLLDGILVIDREDLRKELAKLDQDGQPLKVLLMWGEPRSGKSHPQYLFEQFANERQGYPIYLSSVTVSSVDQVINALFVPVGGQASIPKKETTGEAWYKVVCNELLAKVQQSPNRRRLWIAMDDLGFDETGATMLDEEIRSFFSQLVLMMENFQFRSYFRLLLIHFPDKVPSRWKAAHWKGIKVQANDIRQEHVEKTISNWCRKSGKNLPEEDIKSKAKEIIDEADVTAAKPAGAGKEPRPKVINDLLTAYLDSLQ